jgi:hypothetical protein
VRLTRASSIAVLWGCLAAAAVGAPPTLEIPAEIKADPGDWVVVSPKTDAKAIAYVGLDGLKAFPSSELKDARKLVVNPPRAGRYRFVAVGTLGDEQTATPFVVVVGDAPAPPPVPPGPVPPAPTPDDFSLSVKAAYLIDQSPAKARDAAALASLYRVAATTTVKDATVTTNEALFKDLVAASRILLPEAAIPGVRKVIGARLTGTADKPGPLRNPASPVDRDRAAAEFLAVAAALEGALK